MSTLRAECVKAWAGRGTRVAYLLLFGSMIAFSAFIASGSSTFPPGAGGDNDIVADALAGVLPAAIVAVVVGATIIGNEYGSGMIATSFAATPRRSRVVLAKAFVTWLATTIVAIAAVYPRVSGGPADPAWERIRRTRLSRTRSGAPTRTAGDAGTGLLVGLIALFAVGVGAIVERTAIAIPLVIGSIVVPAMIVVDEDVSRALHRWTPLGGFSIQHTVARDDCYVGPWRGLAVTAAHAVIALALGLVFTRRRDI